MTPDVQALLDLVQQFGIWIIFAWLYIQERRDHNTTRKDKDDELEKIRLAHMADLRQWAGVQQSRYFVQQPAVPAEPERVKAPV